MEIEQKYESIIEFKKQEFHANGWNALEMSAEQLIGKAGADRQEEVQAACRALTSCMLEGDCYIHQPETAYGPGMTVRYYCDNLSESRKKYREVK